MIVKPENQLMLIQAQFLLDQLEQQNPDQWELTQLMSKLRNLHSLTETMKPILNAYKKITADFTITDDRETIQSMFRTWPTGSHLWPLSQILVHNTLPALHLLLLEFTGYKSAVFHFPDCDSFVEFYEQLPFARWHEREFEGLLDYIEHYKNCKSAPEAILSEILKFHHTPTYFRDHLQGIKYPKEGRHDHYPTSFRQRRLENAAIAVAVCATLLIVNSAALLYLYQNLFPNDCNLTCRSV